MLWEYKAVSLGSFYSEHNEKLNTLGKEGWELVCVTKDSTWMVAYLKRPLEGFSR